MGKILIPQDIVEEGKELLRQHGHEVIVGSAHDIETMKKEVADCDAILARTASFTAEVLEAGKKLKVISRHGVGYDNIDVKRAKELGIRVTYTPEANANTVAEMAIGFIISLARNLVLMDSATRNGDFSIRNRIRGFDLEGKKLSIIGLGRIGRLVAKKAAHGLDMKIMAYDPFVSQEQAPDGIKMVKNWDEAFSEADFVSLHLPSMPETKESIDKRTLELMKPTAYLINCARGDLIKEAEAVEILKEKKIAGLATDVYAQEPPENNHPYFSLDNVILTPHNAALTIECMTRMAVQSAEGIIAVLNGKEPMWAVN
ncbi:MAG: hydroxyacid dehydrogenase [Spirochaetia bacterium]|nr:hydroxyacid dehydrogenase [Spirochaetia bacterium]MCF7945303.1 hydroxyacid dehydrogenase [Spirochaetia bacterium]MCF7946586.1 hydroxyacid dehydrogenase [Spirochaetia bacterium]